MEEQEKETQNPGDIRTLLGMKCEVEKMMRLLREIGLFEKI